MGLDIGPIEALSDIYGGAVQRDDLAKQPDASLLVEGYMVNPTCKNSSWAREANIRIIVDEVLEEQPIPKPRILSAACGNGAEPLELALRLSEKGKSFSIDAFDVSPTVIAEAQTGIIRHVGYRNYKTIKQMGDKRLLTKYDGNPVTTEDEINPFFSIKVDPSIVEKVHFATHDIIDGPYKGDEYDIVFCNNLLVHYPEHTRKLILIHLLHSLKNDGVLALEKDETLYGLLSSPQRTAWLKPYYEWKNRLESFGLTLTSDPTSSQRMYKYDQNANMYDGENWAIRDRELVKIPKQE